MGVSLKAFLYQTSETPCTTFKNRYEKWFSVVDASAVFDHSGEKVPDVFSISAIFVLIFLIADLGFTGFRTNNLGLIVTAFLFVITVITGFGVLNIMFTEGHVLDGPFAFLIGTLVFGVALGGFQFSILSTATNSYLSGILGSSDSIVIPLVNLIFAPIGETFLIFGFAAGIHQIIERSSASSWPTALKFTAVAVPPSLIFAVLHGSRGPAFLLLAFGINVAWTAILYYGERQDILGAVPASLALIAGLHFAFNSASYGGIPKFVGDLFAATTGPYARSASAVLLFLGLMYALGLVRLYQVVGEEVLS